MSHHHERLVCRCGAIIMQCRCPDPKRDRVVQDECSACRGRPPVAPTPSPDGATHVAREGARAFVHARIKGGCTGSVDGQNWEHREECNTRTADIEARDASAVEVERTMREALESARTFMESDDCVAVNGPGWNARRAAIIDIGRALARVASLKGGR